MNTTCSVLRLFRSGPRQDWILKVQGLDRDPRPGSRSGSRPVSGTGPRTLVWTGEPFADVDLHTQVLGFENRSKHSFFGHAATTFRAAMETSTNRIYTNAPDAGAPQLPTMLPTMLVAMLATTLQEETITKTIPKKTTTVVWEPFQMESPESEPGLNLQPFK
ncbi:hypothetical protein NQD34_007818 [Periophthalmus magnuspinnatus]|nr:hypothetical protein NQD34_007818 [Periophthalmus magnuspinnatus]